MGTGTPPGPTDWLVVVDQPDQSFGEPLDEVKALVAKGFPDAGDVLDVAKAQYLVYAGFGPDPGQVHTFCALQVRPAFPNVACVLNSDIVHPPGP